MSNKNFNILTVNDILYKAGYNIENNCLYYACSLNGGRGHKIVKETVFKHAKSGIKY